MNGPRSTSTNVRYARFLPWSRLAAMGTNLTVGLGVIVLIGPVLQLTGPQATTAYALTLVVFIPILLTLAQSVPPGGVGPGGLYELARASQDIRRGYWNGWLLLGGIVALGAILAGAGGLAMAILLDRLFSIEVDDKLLSVILVVLIALNAFLGTRGEWRRRAVLVYAGVAILVVLLLWALFSPIKELTGFTYLSSSKRDIEALPFLAIGLWSGHFVLARRNQLRRADKTFLPALLLPTVLGGIVGTLAAYVLLIFPQFVRGNVLALFTLAAAYSPIRELVLLGILLFTALVGLHQTLSGGMQLVGELIEDGVLPKALTKTAGERDVPPYSLIFLAVLMALLAIVFDQGLNLSLATVTLLGSIALVSSRQLFTREKPPPIAGRWRLPLHPLFPLMVFAVCLALIFMQSFTQSLLVLIWLLVGLVLFLLYSRQSTIAVRQRQVLLGYEAPITTTGEKAPHGVLVCVSNPENAENLIRAGVEIATARSGRLLVLGVIDLPDQAPDLQKQDAANEALAALQRAIEQDPVARSIALPLVRLAPSARTGILETAWEEGVATIILGWPENDVPGGLVQEGVVDYLVRRASQEIVVLHGVVPKNTQRILVPMISDGHAPAALALGQAIGRTGGAQTVALKPVRGALTQQRRTQTETHLQQQLQGLESADGVHAEVAQMSDPQQELPLFAEDYDLLLLGMSDEGFLAQTVFAGIPLQIAQASSTPAMLVKRQEPTGGFWLRQIWQSLSNSLPTLNMEQQAAVLTGMRRNARATIDFYVLIALSTTIAFFGLLQNSSAVIIGAMLVAPLMSPILALAFGIVRGNVRMTRQAANATLNGVVLAIGVSALFALSLFSLGVPLIATPEVLARTEPGLLDLLVALASGAVAAYAIGRAELAAALPGVAIAAALVPPLAVVGFGLGTAAFDLAGGASLLFITNLAAIILAGAIVFLLLGIRPPTRELSGESARFGLRMSLVALLAIAVLLLLTTVSSNTRAQRDATILSILTNNWAPHEAEVEDVTIVSRRGDLGVEFTIIDYLGGIGTADIIALQNEISAEIDQRVTLKSAIIRSQLDLVDENTVLEPAETPTSAATATMTATASATSTAIVTPTMTLAPTLASTLTPAAPVTPTFLPGETPVAPSPTPSEEATFAPTIPPTEPATSQPPPATSTVESTIVATVEATTELSPTPPLSTPTDVP